MFKKLILATLAVIFNCGVSAQNLITLTYHDVVDRITKDSAEDSVSLEEFSKQLNWLLKSGYTFVTPKEVLDNKIPQKAILLTFDDGLISINTHVLPVLESLNIPATIAIVGKWHQPNEAGQINIDGNWVPATNFLSIKQLRELANNELITIASHSYDLHKVIPANKYGGVTPAAITREYLNINNDIESIKEQELRLLNDFNKNTEFIRKITGKRPQIIVWPYGRYNGTALTVAANAGYTLSLTLDEKSFKTDYGVLSIGRKYIKKSQDLTTFANYITDKAPSISINNHTEFSIDVDSLNSTDSMDRWLSHAIDRVYNQKNDAVLLNPLNSLCAQNVLPEKERNLQAVLSRASWQIQKKAGAKVYLLVDLSKCQLSQDLKITLNNLMQSVIFDGITVISGGKESAGAKLLANSFAFHEPAKAIASDTDLSKLSLKINRECQALTCEKFKFKAYLD